MRRCWLLNLLWRGVFVAVWAVGFVVVAVIAFFGNDMPPAQFPWRKPIAGAMRVSLVTMPAVGLSSARRGTRWMRLRGLVPGWLTVNDTEAIWEPFATALPSGDGWMVRPVDSVRTWRAPSGSWIVAVDSETGERAMFLARSWHRESRRFVEERVAAAVGALTS